MDPLTALSLACNILAFVDTTKKLVSSARKISHSGADEEHVELSTIAESLQTWLVRVTPPQCSPEESLSSEEKSIRSLGMQCNQVASELLDVLETLKLRSKDRGLARIESFYRSLLGLWKEEQIEGLIKRLNMISTGIQRELASYDRQKILQRLDDLDRPGFRSEEIQALRNDFNKGFDEMSRKIQEDGTKHDTLALLQRAAAKGSRYSAEQFILERLCFEAIDHRNKTIQAAHDQTLSWLFGTGTERSPASFDEWLVSNGDLYWVSGKPGSGKSTLMKFLCNDKRATEKLQIWARQRRLIRANFFFWIAGGQALLKSQEGLLRSLVYQVLSQCPDMIQSAYPKTWSLFFPDEATENYQTNYEATSSATISLTVEDLLGTLEKICVVAITSEVSFSFFIDGLDEYEGNPNDMVEMTRKLRRLPNVKMCVSSREWNDFEEEFGKRSTQKLYMQDFNYHDIHNYVYDTFAKNVNYQEMEERDTKGKALIDGIVKSANGVFFWVFLVVRDFERGLTNGDSIGKLQRRLENDLPEDLNELFERIILRDVPEDYRVQSAQLFSIALEAADTLPFMVYWFAEECEENPAYAIELEVKSLPPQTIVRRKNVMKKRLNVSCRGLLEIHEMQSDDRQASLPSSTLFSLRVNFLHRTVRDFLMLNSTRLTLREWSHSASHSHNLICKALLAQIRITPYEEDYWKDDGPVSRLYSIFTYHYGALERDVEDLQVSQLRSSLDDVLHMRKASFTRDQALETDELVAVHENVANDEVGAPVSGEDHGDSQKIDKVKKLLRKFRTRDSTKT